MTTRQSAGEVQRQSLHFTSFFPVPVISASKVIF